MTHRLYVNAAGFAAPGFDNVEALKTHLDGTPANQPDAWKPQPTSLPPRAARRLSAAIRLAVQAAEQITPALPDTAGWVFASSIGEGDTLNDILTALCQDDIMIQPVKFQNAVHNAAQGQFSIAAKATGPGTSIAGYDMTVAAGLLKAMMQTALEQIPVGVVAFDAPMPDPLHEKRRFEIPMAAALALSPAPTDTTTAALDITCGAVDQSPTDPEAPVADWLMTSNNPTRYALPLLARLHRKDPTPLTLHLSPTTALTIQVTDA
ncbi:MAG: beta-ketoacyl synthase chain length factor [Planctomycetota bacterium]